MTTLDTLEKLADAASTARDIQPYYDYITAANPATIKSLVALCKQQHEAIHMLRLKTDIKYGIPIADEAIAAYERFNGGAE